MNYESSGSEGGPSCGSCINRYTRWNERQVLPCFVCKQYAPEDSELNLAEKTDVRVELEDGIPRKLSQIVIEFDAMRAVED